MPEIEHIEIAPGNVPPFTGSDYTDTTRLFIVTKGAGTKHYVMKYSLAALLDLTRAIAAKSDVTFDEASYTDKRYIFETQSAGGSGQKDFQAASDYKIPAQKNKP